MRNKFLHKIVNDTKSIETILSLLYKGDGNIFPIANLKQQLNLDDDTIKRLVDRLRAEEICNVDHESPWGTGGFGVLVLTDSGHKIINEYGSYSNYLDHRRKVEEDDNRLKELQEQNLQLQNENFDYQKTIRNQEQRIRNLDEQSKFIGVIKGYWWLFATAVGIGVEIGRFWNEIVALFDKQ